MGTVMPTSKIHPARSVVPAATASKPMTASAKKPAAAKAKPRSTEGQSASELIDKKSPNSGTGAGKP